MNSPTTESGSDSGVIELERVPCAICGVDDTRFRHHKYGLDVVQCRRCRLVYANPRLPKPALMTRYSEKYFWDEYMAGLGVGPRAPAPARPAPDHDAELGGVHAARARRAVGGDQRGRAPVSLLGGHADGRAEAGGLLVDPLPSRSGRGAGADDEPELHAPA